MNRGLFDLTNLDSMNDDDIISMNINESSEFAHKNPDTNHPEEHFDKDATGSKDINISVPGGLSETPKAKPYDASSITIPEGDNETPKYKPYDANSISIPSKVTLTSDQYNTALASLKKSFQECVDIIEVLENANVVEKTLIERQDEYIESVIGDQLLLAYEDGPVFEAVRRDDKDEVKDIVRSLRPKIEDYLYDQKIKFYKPNLLARALGGIVLPLEASATISQVWATRLWQVLGVCIAEAGNIKDIADGLTKKYESELKDYKILYAQTTPTLLDLFRTKFNWKNVKSCYFLLVDKKLPKELTDFQKEVEKSIENKEDKKEDKKD